MLINVLFPLKSMKHSDGTADTCEKTQNERLMLVKTQDIAIPRLYKYFME